MSTESSNASVLIFLAILINDLFINFSAIILAWNSVLDADETLFVSSET